MKLYYAPGACSLASRIILHEAGIDASFEQVDLHAKTTERGDDFLKINPSGCVPTLILDDGERVTENVAVLALLADRYPAFAVDAPLGRIRLIEMLSFLSTELHIAFKPFFHSEDREELAEASEAVVRRLDLIANQMAGPYLFGSHFTVADAYLFVMLRWAVALNIPLPTGLAAYFERVAMRPMVRKSLEEEALEVPSGLEAGTNA